MPARTRQEDERDPAAAGGEPATVRVALERGVSVAALARELGVSRTTTARGRWPRSSRPGRLAAL